MSTTYSPYKNQSREGARPMSFWLKPAEVRFLDALSDENGTGRAEALRTIIHAAMAAKRNTPNLNSIVAPT